MLKNILKLSGLGGVIILLAAGCSLPWKKAGPARPTGEIVATDTASTIVSTTVPAVETASTGRLKKFNTAAELTEFLAANNNPETSAAAVEAAVASRPDNFIGAARSPDEAARAADIIKTDGSYVYALVKNELLIIQSAPAGEAAVVSRLNFPSRPQALLIHDNFLAVFGPDNPVDGQPLTAKFRRQNPYTFFKVFDISDRRNPKPVRDLDFEGAYRGSSLSGDYVYFLTRSQGAYLADEPLWPRVLDKGQVLSATCDGLAPCFSPEVYYFDLPYTAFNFFTLTAINLKNNAESLSGQVYILSPEQQAYFSAANLYVTYTPGPAGQEWRLAAAKTLLSGRLGSADQEKLVKIETADAVLLNSQEKQLKSWQIFDHYLKSLSAPEEKTARAEIAASGQEKLAASSAPEKTLINKISLVGNKPVYRATGEVPGHILSNSSWTEDGNFLHLATGDSSPLASSSPLGFYSNIYILDADLKITGRLERLVTTEAIADVRFIGRRAYLLARSAADPIYVISLQDPAKPAVAGAVKISGVHNFIYPADADGTKLFSLGWLADVNSQASSSLKLTLLDLSDLTKPKELDSYLIGEAASDSIVFSDPAAFSYSSGQNSLAIPTAWRGGDGRLIFAGDVIFSTNGNKLSVQGQIDHSSGGYFTQADTWQGVNYYDNTVKRGLYINENLFTFSNKFLKINKLADASLIKSVELITAGNEALAASVVVGATTTPLNIPSDLPPPPPGSGLPPDTSGATGTPDGL